MHRVARRAADGERVAVERPALAFATENGGQLHDGGHDGPKFTRAGQGAHSADHRRHLDSEIGGQHRQVGGQVLAHLLQNERLLALLQGSGESVDEPIHHGIDVAGWITPDVAAF